MRYGCLIPGRVQACQTELTQGREWVRNNGFSKTRSTEVKARVGDGIFGNGWSTFLLQIRPSPTLLTGICKTRICFPIESMTNILQNDLKVRTSFTKDLKMSVILLIILCVYVLLILFSKARFNKLLPKLHRGW